MTKAILKTKRLILRKWGEKKSDIKDILDGCNNLDVIKWLLVLPYPYTKKDALIWINKCKKNYEKKDPESYKFAVELKTEKKVIGGFGLSKVDKEQGTASVGYWINSNYHQKGYGSEALKAVLDFAFKKLNLRRVEARIFVGNPSSAKLFSKFGAKKEGLIRKACVCKADKEIKDDLVYGLLKEEYISN
jgi:RimJ/RimL family protein N-acetyltransferase